MTLLIERRLGDRTRRLLPHALAECVLFVLKQGWACLFGISLLGAIMVTRAIWQDDWPVARYDALVIIAVALQVLFLTLRLETWAEARVILLFHLTGTAMELFKVDAGSWSYPEPGVLKLMGVPLFSGFMYAAVGSYMVRVIRLFDMVFDPFPRPALHFALAGLIYVKFFAHHFLPDIRVVLMLTTLGLYGRTRIRFRIGPNWYWMPLPLAAFLASLFLWMAENIGTITGTWVYAGQSPWDIVSVAKMGSWYLLLYVAFATATLVVRPWPAVTPARDPRRTRPARQRSQSPETRP